MPLQLITTPADQIKRLIDLSSHPVDTAETHYVRATFAKEFSSPAPVLNGETATLLTTCRSLESVGLDLLTRRTSPPKITHSAWHDLLWRAFRLRRTLTEEVSDKLTDLVEEAIDGVLANRQPELRLALDPLPLSRMQNRGDWNQILREGIERSFLLLVRKRGTGYEDLDDARKLISHLHTLQETEEARHFDVSQVDESRRQVIAHERISRAVSYYNLARTVELTAEFLAGQFEQSRQPLTDRGAKDEVDRFIFNAREVSQGLDRELYLFSNRLGAACKALIDASVFAATIPPRPRRFLLDLASRDREGRPVLELWYSQRAALSNSLLDPTKLAVVVSMPTSAGKTLLAELAIIQALNDDPESTIIYLAPTRALVTQVSLTLRRDLPPDMTVRVATPVFELDPVEEQVLQGKISVLVTTPEKFDLLVRINHASVSSVSLVVVDEAHNINDGERGARLELLLATLRRERARVRFLLLTPFANNAGDLAKWLAGTTGVPIIVDWKPNDRVIGAVLASAKAASKSQKVVNYITLDSAHSDCPAGISIPVGLASSDSKNTKEALAIWSATRWAEAKKGGVLLLAESPRSAEERAKEIAESLSSVKSARVELVCRFLDAEAGSSHPLSNLLRRGVAFHHAGLSAEARYLIERLVESREVKILCATTTLAQGVHFPLSAAIIESHFVSKKKGNKQFKVAMEPWKFWNIAGRVGRTLEDALGTIAFVARNDDDRAKVQEYLKEDASKITSTLFEMIRALSGWRRVTFSPFLLEQQPVASAFLQYIVHALAVAGPQSIRSGTDIEALLRGSFVYEQAIVEDPSLAEKLIRLVREYLNELSGKGAALRPYVKLADMTGFSSPSVDHIWREWRKTGQPEPDPYDWQPTNMFPSKGVASGTLVRVIETLKGINEIRLGTEPTGEFSAERVARIASSWVNGASLQQLASDEYGGDFLKCARHIYGTVISAIPWGLRAVEKVAFAGHEQTDQVWKSLDLLPAMVFHGVRTTEAIALRMLNVPRVAAEGLAEQWRRAGAVDLTKANDWMADVTDDQWKGALPRGSELSGSEARQIWQLLEGATKW